VIARRKELTISVGQELISESGSAFSKFAKEIPSLVIDEADFRFAFLNLVSILSIKASMMAGSVERENTEPENASDIKSASKTYVDRLLENIQRSGDFPDEELADNIEQTEKDFRRNFRLRSD
jgi:hypothetical protein